MLRIFKLRLKLINIMALIIKQLPFIQLVLLGLLLLAVLLHVDVLSGSGITHLLPILMRKQFLHNTQRQFLPASFLVLRLSNVTSHSYE